MSSVTAHLLASLTLRGFHGSDGPDPVFLVKLDSQQMSLLIAIICLGAIFEIS